MGLFSKSDEEKQSEAREAAKKEAAEKQEKAVYSHLTRVAKSEAGAIAHYLVKECNIYARAAFNEHVGLIDFSGSSIANPIVPGVTHTSRSADGDQLKNMISDTQMAGVLFNKCLDAGGVEALSHNLSGAARSANHPNVLQNSK